VGGNKIEYAGDTSTPTADLTTAKLVFNSVVSTPNAEFATGDISDFYLFTDMDESEYMWIPIQFLDPEVMVAYELKNLIVDGRVLAEIKEGMYGLPQAGRLAYDQLVLILKRNGYYPCKRTHGLWRHVKRPILFSLVVDNFGIKYVGKQHAQHLFTSLRENYKITEDWTGELYLGITLNWDYKNRTVDLSMPNYVSEALHKFQHPAPYRPEHAPHDWTKPAYGQRQQFITPHDDSDPLDQEVINRVQQVVGTFLYYARAIDSTAMVAINSISGEKAKATQNTAKKVTRLLNYFATHPNATLQYCKSGMVLKLHTDAAYLVEPRARSRHGAHYWLGTLGINDDNGAIKNNASIIKPVVSSIAEAETAGCFYNCIDAIPIRIVLEEMGHTQPPTPVNCDNSTAVGIANQTIKQRRSKAIDMRYYWLQDRECHEQFNIEWAAGANNKADYFTKHFSVSHHRE
jgi:hypothetical protein